jgi:lipopolysaccharide export system permease protein
LTTLDRHMLGRLSATIAAVMAIITIEELLQHSGALYPLVASGEFPLTRLLVLWINLLPLILYHSTPEVVSLAITYQYFRWTENSEIVILRSAGLSGLQIARPGIIASGLFALLCGVNSLCLMSPAWSQVEDIRASAANIFDPDLLQPGNQQELLPGLTIEFTGRRADGGLEDVLLFDTRREVGFQLIWARTGRFIPVADALMLRLDNGTYHILDADKLSSVQFDDMSIPVTVGDSAGQKNREKGYYERGVVELLDPPGSVRGYRPLLGQWLTEGHYRIVAPLQCFCNGILVLGLMIPGYYGGSARFCRTLLAALSAVATAVLPIPLITITANHLEFLPLLYLLAVLPAAVGATLLIFGDRARRKRRAAGRWAEGSLAERPL